MSESSTSSAAETPAAVEVPAPTVASVTPPIAETPAITPIARRLETASSSESVTVLPLQEAVVTPPDTAETPLSINGTLNTSGGVPASIALVIMAAGAAHALLVLHGVRGRRRPRGAPAAGENETLRFR